MRLSEEIFVTRESYDNPIGSDSAADLPHWTNLNILCDSGASRLFGKWDKLVLPGWGFGL
jgi:hypothetical protein